MIEHIEPKAMADTVPVYCAHDVIAETDALVGNPRNPNQHPKEQIEALAKIIKRQGWRHPIVVSNRSGFVVKGHGRLLAAKELKAAQVPVDFQDYESEASEYADLMADNKIQELSELDVKMSAEILMDIKNSGDIELEMSAFTEDALNELLAQSREGEAKDDGFDVDAELERFEKARVGAQDQLKGLYEKAKKEVGEAEAAVFEAHQMFLDDLGITSAGLDKMIKASYKLLGLISYLTAGPKEVRAWTITKGTKAPQAAGKIHSDFERGFIRAEVVSFDDLMASGSYNAAKEKGLVRSEGKEYVMKDGDVVLFRFNV